MTYDKKRETHYQNFGGVNQKGSKYTLDNAQASNLKNLDFFVPNAWSKREGSTQTISGGMTEAVTGLFEYEKLGGASFVLASSNNVLYKQTGLSLTALSSGWGGTQPIDYLTFLDLAFMANGTKCETFNGTSTLPFGQPCPQPVDNPLLGAVGISAFSVMGVTAEALPSVDGENQGVKAILYMGYRYVRSDGYQGPLNFYLDAKAVSPYAENSGGGMLGTTTGNYGQNVTLRITGFTAPANQGITAIALYAAIDHFTNSPQIGRYLRVSALDSWFNVQETVDPALFLFFTMIPFGTTQLQISGAGGWTDFIGKTYAIAYSGMIDCFFATFTPKYIEILNNRLFMSGFSAAPSTTYFSDIAAPESIQIQNFFETRTNDGDFVTSITEYQNNLIIFKKTSFHKLIGDSPDTYSVVELSTEYGCLSNKAVAEYNNILLFLDEKGIVQFNGADWAIISTPVEDVFRRMNTSAALNNAVAVHNALRNQVWFGIPVDGATRNNLTVVYDYLLGAWTFFDGFEAASISQMKGPLPVKRVHYGDYSGLIHHFSPTFYGDNGRGISTVAFTKFDNPDGPNVQNMYRQLFLDVNEVSGLTGTVNVSVYRNYDSTVKQATFSIYQNSFQTRRDFGVQGKSVAFEFGHFSASLPITYYGYTVRRRYLRDV